MALDDVVQGVKVNVAAEGVDDAKAKLDSLDKAIGNLTKSATSAAGGQGGDAKSGISGLTGAFGNLRLAGAGAFQQIAEGVASGNLTGLATLMGGPVAGGVVTATQAITEFVKSQDEAILTNAAMAKELGTTPDVVQALGDSFNKAGVSSQGFQRLVSRMSRDVTNEYSSMMRNVRTDSTSAAEAQLNLTKANKGVLDSFNDMGPENAEQQSRAADLGVQKAKEQLDLARGVPQETFTAQDKARKIQESQLALDEAQTKQEEALEKMRTANADKLLKQQEAELERAKAQEGIRQQALRSIPHISQELQNLGDKTADVSDLAETDMRTFREAIMHLAQPPSGGQADPLEYLKKLADITKQIHDNHPELDTKMGAVLQQASGVASGRLGIDSAHLQGAFQRGSINIDAAAKGQDELKSLGIAQTDDDTKNATEFVEHTTHVMGIFSALSKKLASWASANIGTPEAEGIEGLLEKGIGAVTGGSAGKDGQSWGSILKNLQPMLRLFTDPGGFAFDVASGSFGGKGKGSGSSGPTAEETEAWNKKQADSPTPIPTDPNHPELGNYGPPGSPPPGGASPPSPATGAGAQAGAAAQAAPIINLTVVVPGNGGPVTASAGAPAPAAHWMGGLIKGFYEGGIADPLLAPVMELSGPLYGDSPEMEQKRVMMSIITNSMLGGGNALAGPRDETKPGAGTAGAAEGISSYWDSLITGGHAGGGLIQGFAGGGQPMSQTMADDMETAELAVNQARYDLASAPPHRRKEAQEILAERERDLETLKIEYEREQRRQQRQQQPGQPGHASPYFWTGSSHAGGGSIKGPGNGTSDSILARLSNGEFVMKDAAVRAYGVNFMHAINNMQIPPPKYAMGGMVPNTSLPHFASGGGVEGGGTPIHVHVGDKTFGPMMAGSRVASDLRRFSIDQQTSSTGRKPSWAGG